MELFLRADAFAYRLAGKCSQSWAIAYFDGVMPTDWESLGIDLSSDLKDLYEKCKAAEIRIATPHAHALRLSDSGNPSARMPFGRFMEYKGLGTKVFPTKIIDNGFEAVYGDNNYVGRDFSLNLAVEANGYSWYAHSQPLSGSIEFQFEQPISPTKMLMSTNHSYVHCIRQFKVEAYDSELERWDEIYANDHYPNRENQQAYDLPISNSDRYRVSFTNNTYNGQKAYTNEIAFIVDDHTTVAETFTPTWCIIAPCFTRVQDMRTGIPALLCSVSGVSGDGEVIVDRDSYQKGQPVKALTELFESDFWEAV